MMRLTGQCVKWAVNYGNVPECPLFGSESGTAIICHFAYSTVVQIHNKNIISFQSVQKIASILLPYIVPY
jgi:hypothetical protein